MNRHYDNAPRDESDKADKGLSKLFEPFSQSGEILICDNCHTDYVANDVDAAKELVCPKCAHLPQRYSLTRIQLEKTKSKIGWKTVSDEVRAWWKDIESQHIDQLELVLNLATLLCSKSISIATLYDSFLDSGSRSVAVSVALLELRKTSLFEKFEAVEMVDGNPMPKLPERNLMRIPASAEHGVAVVLLDCGQHKWGVVRLVQRLTKATLQEAKSLVDHAPVIVGRCETLSEAKIVVTQIHITGGYARIEGVD